MNACITRSRRGFATILRMTAQQKTEVMISGRPPGAGTGILGRPTYEYMIEALTEEQEALRSCRPRW